MKTNEEWRLWGERDPLWGVANWHGRDKDGDNPWTDSEFYALGDDWLDFHERWKRYGLQLGSVIEIGCGAGRITKRLSEYFGRVIACDISEGMIRYARERVTAANIDWRLSNGAAIPAETNSVQALFSCHVLQHLESNAAQLACFAEMHRVLAPGGTLLVHVHSHQFPESNRKYARVARAGYAAFLLLSDVRAAIRRATMRVGGGLYMHAISIEQRTLYNGLQRSGFHHIEFITFPVRTNGGLHTCVLATK